MERTTQENTGEVTANELERLLEVKVSKGINFSEIERNMKTHLAIRFIVTKGFDIIIAPASRIHEAILEDNGLEWSDCWITNGSLSELDNGGIEFTYHTTKKDPGHRIIEKKIISFLENRTGTKLSQNKISFTYSSDIK